MWYVYIIEADDDSLYTGITTDVAKRYLAHTNKKGAKYFYSRHPKSLKYTEVCKDRSAASKREHAIKKLSRQHKIALIAEYESQQ